MGNLRPTPKAFSRNFKSRRRLLPFVFGAIHHLDHRSYQCRIELPFAGNVIGRLHIFNIINQNLVKDVIRGQRVAVFLVRTQFGRGGLVMVECGITGRREFTYSAIR